MDKEEFNVKTMRRLSRELFKKYDMRERVAKTEKFEKDEFKRKKKINLLDLDEYLNEEEDDDVWFFDEE